MQNFTSRVEIGSIVPIDNRVLMGAKTDFLKLEMSKILSSGPNMAHSISLLLMCQPQFVYLCVCFFFLFSRERECIYARSVRFSRSNTH